MRKPLFLLILIGSIFIINNLIHSIYNLWQKRDLLTSAQKQLEEEKKENWDLKNKLSQVQSLEFVEKEARNRLFMVKPGENQVIISKDMLKASESGKIKHPENKANWEKWLELFF